MNICKNCSHKNTTCDFDQEDHDTCIAFDAKHRSEIPNIAEAMVPEFMASHGLYAKALCDQLGRFAKMIHI